MGLTPSFIAGAWDAKLEILGIEHHNSENAPYREYETSGPRQCLRRRPFLTHYLIGRIWLSEIALLLDYA